MSLRLAGYATTLFVDGTYRWIYEQTYLWSGTPADEMAVLSQLIKTPGYGLLDFGPGGDPGDVDGKVHGPYLAEGLSAKDYLAVDAAAAVAGLRSWAETEGPLPARIEVALDRIVAMIESATGRYRLPDLSAKARVARRYLDGWHELVLLDRATATLTLIAGSED